MANLPGNRVGRAIVVQYGGRRRYAVAAALAQQGRLEAFYTDFCVGRGVGRVAPLIGWLPYLSTRVDVSRRLPPANVLVRTRTFLPWALSVRHAQRCRVGSEERVRRLWMAHENAGAKMLSRGFGLATHVVMQFGEAISFARGARESGLTVVTDVNVAPSTERIVHAERKSFPGWEHDGYIYGQEMANGRPWARPVDEMLSVSHAFICPSEFVRDDLIKNFGVAPERARLVPYAVSERWSRMVTSPTPGRILFAAGTVDLRKGIHVLARASTLLRDRGRHYSIIVAGSVPDSIVRRPETSALTFVGRLSSRQIEHEFGKADLLVCPSLAEGSAGVTYEALGCGLPVVATREAGSIVRDGVEGRIVAARDPLALAEAIDSVVLDRDRREAMSVAARGRAEQFNLNSFQERLVVSVFSDGTMHQATEENQ